MAMEDASTAGVAVASSPTQEATLDRFAAFCRVLDFSVNAAVFPCCSTARVDIGEQEGSQVLSLPGKQAPPEDVSKLLDKIAPDESSTLRPSLSRAAAAAAETVVEAVDQAAFSTRAETKADEDQIRDMLALQEQIFSQVPAEAEPAVATYPFLGVSEEDEEEEEEEEEGEEASSKPSGSLEEEAGKETLATTIPSTGGKSAKEKQNPPAPCMEASPSTATATASAKAEAAVAGVATPAASPASSPRSGKAPKAVAFATTTTERHAKSSKAFPGFFGACFGLVRRPARSSATSSPAANASVRPYARSATPKAVVKGPRV